MSLLAPAGFAVIVVLTSRGETASLAAPAVLLAALAGFLLICRKGGWGIARVRSSLDGWAIGAAVAVFLIFAAPVALSGSPTFTGYIKLDDTATWMAFVDRVMNHGRDLSGLEPSS